MKKWTQITPHTKSIYTDIHLLDMGDAFVIKIYKGKDGKWYTKVDTIWGNKIRFLSESVESEDDVEIAKKLVLQWVHDWLEVQMSWFTSMKSKIASQI